MTPPPAMSSHLLARSASAASRLPERPQAVVVGAGPAGCAAASALGRAGIATLLLERGRPGKDKVCGDALLPTAVAALAQLGVTHDQLASLGGFRFCRIDLQARGQLLWQVKLDDPAGWIVPRARLDQLLRDLVANLVDVRYGTTVTDLQRRVRSGWRLTLRHEGASETRDCDAVVLATGAANILARHWGTAGDPVPAASVSAYASMPAPVAPIFEFIDSCQPGYGWVFPLPGDQANIGLCTLGSGAHHLSARTMAYLATWSSNHGMPRGGAAPIWSGRGTSWHHPAGLVSCGDAAGLVDPITGEGITAALISGHQAGIALADFVSAGGNPAPLATYSAWVGARFGQEYRNGFFRQLWKNLCGFGR